MSQAKKLTKLDWEKITGNSTCEKIVVKLSEISRALLQYTDNVKDISLMGGKTGIALFLFYYGKWKENPKYCDCALDITTDVFYEINHGFSQSTFASGLAGIGWAVDHLSQNNFIERSSGETFGKLEPFFYETMMADLRRGEFDFLHGALGNGTYFLNRLANHDTRNYLIDLVDGLEKISHKDKNGGIKWQTIKNFHEGTFGFSINLSHGIASIITFLGKLYELGIYREKVSMLLNGAVKYLLAQRLDTAQYSSNFPTWALEDEPPTASRLAWCYGDLGIGIGLWQAAKNTSNKEWESIALEVLLHSTHRVNPEENSVVDAGLCHGTAGIAHIYNRMYHYTGEVAFKKSALYWFEQTLKMAKFHDGLAGYRAYQGKKDPVKEPAFLEGTAGIGLALISAVSTIEPEWDRALLLS